MAASSDFPFAQPDRQRTGEAVARRCRVYGLYDFADRDALLPVAR